MNSSYIFNLTIVIAGLCVLLGWGYVSKWGRRAVWAVPVGTAVSGAAAAGVTVLFLAMIMVYGQVADGNISVAVGPFDGPWGIANLSAVVLAVGHVICIAAVMTVLLRHRRTTDIRTQPQRLATIGGGIGYGLLCFPAAMLWPVMVFLVTVQLYHCAGYDTVQGHPILEMIAQKPPRLTQVLVLIAPVLTTPLAEECLFRGVIQPFVIRKARQMNLGDATWVGIAATSAVFAMLHPTQMVPAMMMLVDDSGIQRRANRQALGADYDSYAVQCGQYGHDAVGRDVENVMNFQRIP